jgi:hypothetical protein
MTEPDMILTAISTVGFPIVAFLLMFWFATKVIRENTKAFQNLQFAILKLIEEKK